MFNLFNTFMVKTNLQYKYILVEKRCKKFLLYFGHPWKDSKEEEEAKNGIWNIGRVILAIVYRCAAYTESGKEKERHRFWIRNFSAFENRENYFLSHNRNGIRIEQTFTFSTFVYVICDRQIFDTLTWSLFRITYWSGKTTLLRWFTLVTKFLLPTICIIWNEK